MNKKAQSLVLKNCANFLEVTETSINIKYKNIEGIIIFDRDFIQVIASFKDESDSRKWRYRDIERLGEGIKDEVVHFLDECSKKLK